MTREELEAALIRAAELVMKSGGKLKDTVLIVESGPGPELGPEPRDARTMTDAD
jgi:hypothetical protein